MCVGVFYINCFSNLYSIQCSLEVYSPQSNPNQTLPKPQSNPNQTLPKHFQFIYKPYPNLNQQTSIKPTQFIYPNLNQTFPIYISHNQTTTYKLFLIYIANVADPIYS